MRKLLSFLCVGFQPFIASHGFLRQTWQFYLPFQGNYVFFIRGFGVVSEDLLIFTKISYDFP